MTEQKNRAQAEDSEKQAIAVRQGVVSGRILTVLLVSLALSMVGAAVMLFTLR